MERKYKATPPRLPVIFQTQDSPLYLVTINTLWRRPLLATSSIHEAFRDYATRAATFQVGVGRYVLMPDHIHLFIRMASDIALGRWVGGFKQRLGKVLITQGHLPLEKPGIRLRSFWQPGFFDHLLRRDESYAVKWDYVWRNPVRAGLVKRSEDWPWQGEIEVVDRA